MPFQGDNPSILQQRDPSVSHCRGNQWTKLADTQLLQAPKRNVSHPTKIQLTVVQVAPTRQGSIMSALLKHILPADSVNKIQHNGDQEWVWGAEMMCKPWAKWQRSFSCPKTSWKEKHPNQRDFSLWHMPRVGRSGHWGPDLVPSAW